MTVSEEAAWRGLVSACQTFVDKVDNGLAQSEVSYQQMKKALALAKECRPPRGPFGDHLESYAG